MRKKVIPCLPKMGTLLHFHILAMPRFLAIPWVLGGGVGKSVFHVYNLSVTTVIIAFTSSFLPPILGSLYLSSEYIFALPALRHGKSLLCLFLRFQQSKSKPQVLHVSPVSSEPCWAAWTPLRWAVVPELPKLSHDSNTRSVTGAKAIGQLCLCITWAAIQKQCASSLSLL